MKHLATRVGALLVGWSLLAIILTVNRSIYRLTVGEPARFLSTLRIILLDYWIWAALTPAVFFLARRFQFSRPSLARSTAIHFCGYLGLSCCHELAAVLLKLPIYIPVGFHGSIIKLRIVQSLNENLWMYWPIVVVWSLFEYYRRYREHDLNAAQLNERLARAELQGLRNQLHPHFIFNTLNTIATFVHEDVEAADDTLADLAHLLRAYLGGNEEHEIALSLEVELLNTYVRIQQRRFEDRLSWSTDIPENLSDAMLPSLLLQPLVENAVLHGISPRPTPGRVHLKIAKQNSSLLLEVRDDGVGFVPNSQEGVGISNTRARLLHMYGNGQSFEVSSEASIGTVVRIILPLRFAVAKGEAPNNEHSNGDRRRRTTCTTPDLVPPGSRS